MLRSLLVLVAANVCGYFIGVVASAPQDVDKDFASRRQHMQEIHQQRMAQQQQRKKDAARLWWQQQHNQQQPQSIFGSVNVGARGGYMLGSSNAGASNSVGTDVETSQRPGGVASIKPQSGFAAVLGNVISGGSGSGGSTSNSGSQIKRDSVRSWWHSRLQQQQQHISPSINSRREQQAVGSFSNSSKQKASLNSLVYTSSKNETAERSMVLHRETKPTTVASETNETISLPRHVGHHSTNESYGSAPATTSRSASSNSKAEISAVAAAAAAAEAVDQSQGVSKALEASVNLLVEKLNVGTAGLSDRSPSSSTSSLSLRPLVASSSSTAAGKSTENASPLQKNHPYREATAPEKKVLNESLVFAELRNVSRAIVALRQSLNRTGEEVQEAAAAAAKAAAEQRQQSSMIPEQRENHLSESEKDEEASLLAVERESEEMIENIEKGVFRIDYKTGKLHDRMGRGVALPQKLVQELLVSSSPPSTTSSPAISSSSIVPSPLLQPLSQANQTDVLESSSVRLTHSLPSPWAKNKTSDSPVKSTAAVPTTRGEGAAFQASNGTLGASSHLSDSPKSLSLKLTTVPALGGNRTKAVPSTASSDSSGNSVGGSGSQQVGFWGQLAGSAGLSRPLQMLDMALEGATEGLEKVVGISSSKSKSPVSPSSAASLSASESSSSFSSSLVIPLSRPPTARTPVPTSAPSMRASSVSSRCVSQHRRCRVRKHDGLVDESVCWTSTSCASFAKGPPTGVAHDDALENKLAMELPGNTPLEKYKVNLDEGKNANFQSFGERSDGKGATRRHEKDEMSPEIALTTAASSEYSQAPKNGIKEYPAVKELTAGQDPVDTVAESLAWSRSSSEPAPSLSAADATGSNPQASTTATSALSSIVSRDTEEATHASESVASGVATTSGAANREERLEKLVARLKQATEDADPAAMHTDLLMLQDFALVLVAASFGGILFVALFRGSVNVVHLGFVFGGFLVGPSSPLLHFVEIDSPYRSALRRADAVHTIAMLGPMFDLFLSGMRYAAKRALHHQREEHREVEWRRQQTLSTSAPSSPIPTYPADSLSSSSPPLSSPQLPSSVPVTPIFYERSAPSSPMLDPQSARKSILGVSVGSGTALAIFAALYFGGVFASTGLLSLVVQWTDSSTEAALFAAAVTLSGTSTVLSVLSIANARHLPIGRALAELMAIQDLFLAPLLAIPTALHNRFLTHRGDWGTFARTLALDVGYVTMVVLASRIVLPFVLQHLLVGRTGKVKNMSSVLHSGGVRETGGGYSDQSDNYEELECGGSGSSSGGNSGGYYLQTMRNRTERLDSGSDWKVDGRKPSLLSTSQGSSTGSGENRGSEYQERQRQQGLRASTELLTLIIVGFTLGVSLISEWMDLSYGFGSLLAGFLWGDITSRPSRFHARYYEHGHGREAEGVVQTLSSLFGAVYMASLGMIVSPEFIWTHASYVLALVAAVATLKALAAGAALKWLLSSSTETGKMNDMKGTESATSPVQQQGSALQHSSRAPLTGKCALQHDTGRLGTSDAASSSTSSPLRLSSPPPPPSSLSSPEEQRTYLSWPLAIAGGTTLAHVSMVALYFIGRAQALGIFSRELHLVVLSAAFVFMAFQQLPMAALRASIGDGDKDSFAIVTNSGSAPKGGNIVNSFSACVRCVKSLFCGGVYQKQAKQ